MTNQETLDLMTRCIITCEDRLQWANDFLNSENPRNEYTISLPSELSIDLIKHIEGNQFNFSGDCLSCTWFSLREAQRQALFINKTRYYDRKVAVMSKIELAKKTIEHETKQLESFKLLRESARKELQS